ncbi:MAG: ribonuclease III [Eubacterium sp.]|nr:ribonuclease III [Eubacterium sp.]MCI8919497.1 ribonuclease III [Eubacterium sp.]
MRKQLEFQQVIGYEFIHSGLLVQALTHSSYANERRMRKHSDNERLEFLGDAVLEIIASEFLYHHFPDLPEGELTKMRASLVCEQTLAACTKELDLGSYLLLGRGEQQTGGRQRHSILSDALEALIGAIYLDGGFASAKEFVMKYILTDIANKQLFYDSKTILQEMVQGQGLGAIHYRLAKESGPDHNKLFQVELSIDGSVVGLGEGHTKKAAEQEAAYNALVKLKEK